MTNRLTSMLAASAVLAGCATIKKSELCADFEECPVFRVDDDRYPVAARDARIELTGFETGAWVTVSGGEEPVLGALGQPPGYERPDPRPDVEFPETLDPAPVPSCSALAETGSVPLEGVVSQRPAAVELDDGRLLVAWVEAKGKWVGDDFDESDQTCETEQKLDRLELKVARFETGRLEPCYTLRLGNEPVWDIAAAASEKKLHFAVSGGDDGRTHVRYFSVGAAELCSDPPTAG